MGIITGLVFKEVLSLVSKDLLKAEVIFIIISLIYIAVNLIFAKVLIRVFI